MKCAITWLWSQHDVMVASVTITTAATVSAIQKFLNKFQSRCTSSNGTTTEMMVGPTNKTVAKMHKCVRLIPWHRRKMLIVVALLSVYLTHSTFTRINRVCRNKTFLSFLCAHRYRTFLFGLLFFILQLLAVVELNHPRETDKIAPQKVRKFRHWNNFTHFYLPWYYYFTFFVCFSFFLAFILQM